MNIEKRFQLLGLLRDDGLRTFRAKEIASGRDLQVHIFHGDSPANRAVFEQLLALPLSSRGELLETGFEENTPYIVTEPLPPDTNARAWFGRLVKPAQPDSSDPAKFAKVGMWKTSVDLRAPASSDPEPGEFTRMFQSPAPSGQSIADEPGEFTRMFQSPVGPAIEPVTEQITEQIKIPVTPVPVSVTRTMLIPAMAASQPPVGESDQRTRLFQAQPAAEPTAPAPAPPVQSAPEPGEFTRVFQQVQPNQVASAAAPPHQASAPGEFTRMFQPHESPTAPPPAPPSPQPSGAGEFTRFFQSPMQPAPLQEGVQSSDPVRLPAASPPPPNRMGEFTQMFGNPSQPPPATAPPGSSFSAPSATKAFAVPVAPPAPRPVSQGPGEYTKMMSANALPTLGQSAPQPPVAAMKPANTMLPLLIVGGVILLFAILIVIFFVMRHR